MTQVVELASVNQVTGVVIAVIGTVVTAPDGTRHIFEGLTKGTRRARGRLARIFPFLRRDTQVHAITATGHLHFGGNITVTASGRVWQPDAPVDERIEALRQHISEVEAEVRKVAHTVREEGQERALAIADLRAELATAKGDLRKQLADRDHDRARIDGRGLPMIGMGIALCGIPEQLASLPWSLGWAAPIAGVAVTLGGLRGHYAQRRVEREESQ